MTRRLAAWVVALAAQTAAAEVVKLAPDAFPVTITNPGSYRLTADVLVTNPGAHGITVAANDVSINLRGRELKGPGPGAGSGIFQLPGFERLAVSNGNIVGWQRGAAARPDDGHAVLARGVRSSFADLYCISNSVGARLAGLSVVSNCNFQAHETGVVSGDRSLLYFVTAFTIAGDAFVLGSDAVAALCTAYDAGLGYRMEAPGAMADYCTAYSCTGAGFAVSGPARLRYCAAYSNDTGIAAGAAVELLEPAVNDNRGDGISAESKCMLRGAAAVQNGRHGIRVGSDCEVSGSGGNKNALDGIHAAGNGNLIEECKAFDNGAAGIRVLGTGNTVAANQAARNAGGAFVIAPSNTVGRIVSSPEEAKGDEDANIAF